MPVAIPMVFWTAGAISSLLPIDVSWSKNPQVKTAGSATYTRDVSRPRVRVTDDHGATERSAAMYYNAIRVEGVRTRRRGATWF